MANKYVDLTGLQEFLNKLKAAYAGNTSEAFSTFTVGQAGKLSTARTFTFTGDATGSGSFDGSTNVSIALTVGDDSHDHTLAHVTDLADAISLSTSESAVTGITIGNSTVTATLADGTIATTQDSSESSTKVATTAFVQAAIDAKISSQDALRFKGVVDGDHALPSTGYEAGDVYKVGAAGTYAGKVCEVGDMIICVKDYVDPASNDDWAVVQGNIDGAVTGPASAVSENIAVFDGATGKVIKDGGIAKDAIVLNTRKVNNKALSSDITLDGSDIALTGYAEASAIAAVAAADTINAAIGKVEYKADANASAITILNGNDTTAGSVAKSIKDAIEALDVASAGGAGKYISAISEADGKIVPVASDIASTVASDGTAPVSGSAVFAAIKSKVESLDYSGATAGYYVTQVTEADGVIAVTREAKGTITSESSALVDGSTVYAAIEAAKGDVNLVINSGDNGTFTYQIGSQATETVSVLTTVTTSEVDALFGSST